MVILPGGRVITVRDGDDTEGERGRGRKVGKEPKIWDALLGRVSGLIEGDEGNVQGKQVELGQTEETGEYKRGEKWIGEKEVKGDWHVCKRSADSER